MKKITGLIFLFLPVFMPAQIYFDASDNLPNSGAKKPSMDVQAADIDNDGDLDIVLANEGPANTVLINDGNGVFTDGTPPNLTSAFQDSEDVAIADYDGDGKLDLIFCSEDDYVNGESDVHEYYLGNGLGGFVESSFQFTDTEANAVTTVDINDDGWPDVFFGNNGGTGVFINNHDGTFSEENNRVEQLNKTTQDLAFADVDGDGDLDLFEGNENGNILHINDGSGHFTNETNERLPTGLSLETRKVTFGDADGDGDLDIFLSNVEFIPGRDRQNRLFINDGSGTFSDMTQDQLPSDNDHTIDAIFEDVDLDGDLDIVVANVFGAPIKIYGNDGMGSFSNVTQDVLGNNYVYDALGVIAEDLNGDGFRDLYICDRFQSASNRKDLLLVREVSSSVDEKKREDEILVYPNPVSTYFFVETKTEMPDSIVLFDVSGKSVASLFPKRAGETKYRIDVSGSKISSGMYFFELNGIKKTIFVSA
ncbi:MAG: T9SS type A sorting domain-containing protein [Chitinophagales bacterium]|nr:T9SS type A sorting domain-containing protein [Chitinophagales bacterium]